MKFGNLFTNATSLYKERDRLATFKDWTCKNVRKEELAMLGFYFRARPDNVKCVFCNVVIYNFEKGDSVLAGHLAFSPNCPLLRRRKTLNEAIDSDKLDGILPAAIYDECGSRPCEDDAYPGYELEEERLRSFVTIKWPIDDIQRPFDLARAGFYYSGHKDVVICYSCGIALGEWKISDIPRLEHVKNQKKDRPCMFIKSTNKLDRDIN